MLNCPNCGEPLQTLDINFDYYSGVVTCGPKTLKLPEMQLTMLECLIDAYPYSVSEAALYDAVYAGRDAEDLPAPHSLHVTMHRLKARFADAKFPVRVARIRKDSTTMDFILVATEDRKTQAA